MNRKIVIDEAYRKQMAEDAAVHPDALSNDLTVLTSRLVKYTTDIDWLLREYKAAEKEFEQISSERYDFFRFKGEMVRSEKDSEKALRGDPEVIESKKKMEAIEADFKFLTDYREILKGKYWNMKSLLDYEKFKHGD